jgi:hypothetical protein
VFYIVLLHQAPVPVPVQDAKPSPSSASQKPGFQDSAVFAPGRVEHYRRGLVGLYFFFKVLFAGNFNVFLSHQQERQHGNGDQEKQGNSHFFIFFVVVSFSFPATKKKSYQISLQQ